MILFVSQGGQIMYFDKAYFDENNKPLDVQIICDICGRVIKISDMFKFQIVQNEYCVVKNEYNIKCSCGNSCTGLIEYKKLSQLDKSVVKTYPQTNIISKPEIKCPYCHSDNVRKISGGERAVSVLGLGLLSNKINKSFKCKNCGGTF